MPLLLLGIAVAPAVFMLYFLWLRDRFEREPLKLVWKVFFFGALSAIPAFVLERYVMWPLGVILGYRRGFEGTLWQAFLVAGLVEELCKALLVRWAIWRNPNFNEPMDGIVYFGAGALGFATLENILYVLQGGMLTGISRAVLSVPGHALFGVVMGYHFGLYRFGNPQARGRHLLLGLVAPTLLHGIYDAIALNVHNSLVAVLMYPLVAYMWVHALKEIGAAEEASPFNGTAHQCHSCQRGFMGEAYRYCPYCGTELAKVSASHGD